METAMQEQREDDLDDLEKFNAGRAALEVLKNAPCVDGVYVLDDRTKLTPEARDALMWEIDQDLQAMVREALDELVASGELVRSPDGKYASASRLRQRLKIEPDQNMVFGPRVVK
jgi:hypothetical protein